MLDDRNLLHAARGQKLGTPAAGCIVMLKQQSLMAVPSSAIGLLPACVIPYSWAYLALAKHLRVERYAEF